MARAFTLSPLGCMEAQRSTYFQEVLEFLEKYRWIYDFKLTNFLLDGVWRNVPNEWMETMLSLSTQELNQLPYGFCKDTWPLPFQDFLSQSQHFSLPRDQSAGLKCVQLDPMLLRGMNPKKQHEVAYMAQLVGDVCASSQCDVVIDVGAGLGYLGQVLNKKFGLRVIGLESKECRTHTAASRTEKQELSPSAIESITFELLDTPDSFAQFSDLLHNLSCKEPEKFSCIKSIKTMETCHQQTQSESDTCSDCSSVINEVSHQASSRICLIGLHSCGSLTPTMLKLAASTDEIISVVCVGCCYHAMSVSDGICESFPLSECLKRVMLKSDAETPWKVSTYALRLAAQETRSRWQNQTHEDHAFHMKNVIYRGLLEVFAHQHGDAFRKEKRYLARKKHFASFDAYITAVLERTTLEGQSDVCQKLHHLHDHYQQYFPLVEPFTALQVLLQPVLESLILLDRLQYMEEQHIQTSLVPVFSENISPRNIAIVADRTCR